jgi:hypothetical protein
MRNQLTQQQAASFRQMVLTFPDMPSRAKMELLGTVDRVTEAKGPGWSFMMVDPVRNAAVQEWLLSNARRPMKTVVFWAHCMFLADRHDGSVPIDRGAVAKEMKVPPDDISRMLGDLTKCHALIREREGSSYTYRVNPRVATNLREELRTPAQVAAPEIPGISGRFPLPQLTVVA